MADNADNPSGNPYDHFAKKKINFRLAVICLAAASVGLSIAIISIAKLLLLAVSWRVPLARSGTCPADGAPAKTWYCQPCCSRCWRVRAEPVLDRCAARRGLGSLAKYGKLLIIVVMILLIRDRREARYALAAFSLRRSYFWWWSAHGCCLPDLPVPGPPRNTLTPLHRLFRLSRPRHHERRIRRGVLAFAGPGPRAATARRSPWRWRGAWPTCSSCWPAAAATWSASPCCRWPSCGSYPKGIAIAWPYCLLLVLLLFVASPTMRERLTRLKEEVQAYSPKQDTNYLIGCPPSLLANGGSSHSPKGHGPGGASAAGAPNTTGWNARKTQHKNIDPNGNPHQEYLLLGCAARHSGPAAVCRPDVLRAARHHENGDTLRSGHAIRAAGAGDCCLFNASLYDGLIGDFFCVLIGLLLALGYSNGLRILPHPSCAT
jgi:O-antigen ligase